MALSAESSRSAQANHPSSIAHMYPEAGPAEDCESSAERKLYYKFRERLGPAFHVIHSAKWNTIAPNGRMQPGEADFVIIHPELGIAILEVKGGRITQEPKSGHWYTIDRNDKKSAIQDPFNQAMRSAKVLERKLRNSPTTRPFAESYRICYGVWFPDIPWKRDGRGDLRMLDEQTLDQVDMQQPVDAVTRLMRFAQGTSPAAPLTDDALAALLNLLVPDFTMVESPLSEVISADDTTINHLTSEQADRLMAMWQHHRQMAIPGHAGTGKTAIAMEMAWRLAQNGSHVLLMCANRTLAEHLRERLLTSDRHYDPHLFEILSLHELVNNIGVAGRVRHNEIRKLTVSVLKEQDTLAAILATNLDTLEQRAKNPVYDAVIVDEAQDINEPFWPQLRRLLRASEYPDEAAASNFYVFYDPAQRDLPGDWDPKWPGIEAVTPPLTVNCRNSGGIYELMAALNPRLHDAPFRGPLGRPVLYREPAAERIARDAGTGGPTLHVVDAETATLEQVLNELIEGDGVRPEQILVVTCRSSDGRSKNQTRWRLRDQQEIGRRSLEWLKARRSSTRIGLATIRSSKGLESPVVILAELDGIAGAPRHDQLLYTAISRAKHQLIVLAPPDTLKPTQPGWWERFFKRAPAPQEPTFHTQPAMSDPFIGPDDPDDSIIGLAIPIPIPDHSSDHHDSSKDTSKDTSKDISKQPKASQQPSSGGPEWSDTPASFDPSPYQQAIFEFVRNGHGNGIVSAVAGSGKTTTLLEAAKLLNTRNALFLAFNKSIADYLATKLKGTPMAARTIHGIGMGILGRYWGRDAVISQPDTTKYLKLCRAWAHDNLANLDHPRRQVVSAALRELVDYTRATLTTPSDVHAMHTMASHFGVECDVVALDALIQAVPQLLAEGARIATGGEEVKEQEESAYHVIDFMDMLYLPHIWNLPANYRADWIFVDEAQDLNAAQLALALKCLAPDGRMLFVGDRHQAIYGFSGADSDAFDHIKRDTRATELPLSVCYRCPTSHIALAQQLVPEIEPRLGAPEGVIAEVMPAQLPQMVRKDDLILGRKTAPLIELCIKLIRDRVFARVKGREIGVRLTQVVQEVTHMQGYSWQRFGECLQAYERQQAEKISQFDDAEAELVRLNDRVAAVHVCYELFDTRDAAELCRKIDELFDSERPDVTLSTVHKAKGLEADRIFLLNPDEMPLKWTNQQPWELQQERNIKYVALTRAKGELYLVRSPLATNG